MTRTVALEVKYYKTCYMGYTSLLYNVPLEYTDGTRGAKYSDIRSGDKVLLRQALDSKLSPNFEPDPYVVAHKDGENAVVLQDAKGNCKMRNIAHMQKFVEPATIEIGALRGSEQPELPEQVVKP